MKTQSTADVVISQIAEGQGKHIGRMGNVAYGVYNNGDFTPIGTVGGGFTDELRQDMLDNPRNYFGLVMEIKYNDLVGRHVHRSANGTTGEFGTPRHPQFLQFRTDKLPTDCELEQFRRQ